MSDYISREKVLALGYWHGDHPDFDHPNPDGVDAVDVADIEDIPTADVVEVVRCGKCKYKRDTLYCRLRETPVIVSNADFCSFGKPKE